MAEQRQQLLEAVNVLYNHPDDKVKKQAGVWLEQWQQSLEAWSVSDAVLHDQSCPMDARCFCAQTLRTKVLRDFEELPAGAIGSLRKSIMDLLLQYAAEASLIRVQLCLALAAMATHVPGAQWGQGGVVQWLLSQMEGVPPATSIPVMLEMLKVLPEEAQNLAPSVKPERRRQLREEMVGCAPMALQVLASCLSHSGEQTRAQVLGAYASWLLLIPGAGLSGSVLAQHPLTSAALEGLNSPRTFDPAVEALSELIYSSSNRGNPDQDSMALVSRLVPSVMALIPRFSAASKLARAEQENLPTANIATANEDDEETTKGMARLFAEVGEAFTATIASGSPDAIKPVEALLEVARHPDDDICAMSFDFWHRLSKQLNSSFSVASTSSAEESKQVVQRRKELFWPAYTQLVSLIRGRVRIPDDYESWREDELKDFKNSRYSIADTLVDAGNVLGADKILQLLVEPLQSLGQPGSNFDWRTAEAALFCIKGVCRSVAVPNHPTIVALFQGLPQLPNVPKLQHTAALTLAAYSKWLSLTLKQGGLQNLMPQLLQMINTAFGSAESAGAAAMALRDICEACGAQLGGYIEAMMQLYQQVQTAGALAESSAPNRGLALDEEDVQQIMEAVALVASQFPEAQRRATLNAMLLPVVQPLQAALQQHQQQSNGNGMANHGSTSPDRVLTLFDRISVVLRHTQDPGAVTDALTQIWPLLERALQLYVSSATAVERLCRTPRYALKTAGKLAATGTLVMTMMEALPKWFSAAPHSSFLYLASEIVKVFGDVPRQEGALGELLGRMLETACLRLQKLRQFNEDPDLADDTFLLASRVLSYSPKLLLSNTRLLSTLLDSAIAGVLVQHREACESILVFISRLFDGETLVRCAAEVRQQLNGIFAPKGPTTFRLLLAGVTGALQPSRVLEISEAVTALLKICEQQGLLWFTEAVNLLPEEAATAADRAGLCKLASDACKKSNSTFAGVMDEALRDLSELVRRNRRSQEAAQRALLPPELQQTLW